MIKIKRRMQDGDGITELSMTGGGNTCNKVDAGSPALCSEQGT